MQPNTNHTPLAFTVRNNQLYFIVGVKWFKVTGTVTEVPTTELFPIVAVPDTKTSPTE